MARLAASLSGPEWRGAAQAWAERRRRLDEPLLAAAAKGRHMRLAAALRSGGDPSAREPEKKQSALMLAVRSKSLPCVKLLLDTGKIDLGFRDELGRNAWLLAAAEGNEGALFEIGRAHADQENAVRTKESRAWARAVDKSNRGAVHWAAQAGSRACVELSMASGASGDALAGSHSRSALMMAAQAGSSAVVAALIKAGIDPKAVNQRGECALACAVNASQYEAAELLAPASGPAMSGASLLAAARDGDEEMAMILLPWADPAIRDDVGATPAMLAAASNCLGAFEAFLPLSDPWESDFLGRGILLYATRSGSQGAVERAVEELARADRGPLALCVELGKAWGSAVDDDGRRALVPFLSSRARALEEAVEIAVSAAGGPAAASVKGARL